MSQTGAISCGWAGRERIRPDDRRLGQGDWTSQLERVRVVIILTLVTAIDFWLYKAPGRGMSIEQPNHAHNPAK
jgi:hypothetical protein